MCQFEISSEMTNFSFGLSGHSVFSDILSGGDDYNCHREGNTVYRARLYLTALPEARTLNAPED